MPAVNPAAPAPRIPPIVGGEELYNRIMGDIEPDLTTDQIPLIPQKYKNETAEQTKARGERYAKAFAEYEKRLAAYDAQWDRQLQGFEKTVVATLEEQDRTTEDTDLSGLEAAITQA